VTVDCAVVGGGIAGLSAAYQLTRAGRSCVVLEASGRPGGVILSETIDRFTVDAGPDSLLIQKPAAIDLCREVGLADRLIATTPPRIAYVQRGGRLHPLAAGSVLGIPTTAGPFLRSGLFSSAGKIRMGAELFVPPRRDGADESIGAFMTRRFGREVCEYLAEPLLAGIHAGDVDRLSVNALFPRLVDAERKYGSLIRGFRHQTSAAQPDGAFRSLRGGLSELVCALARVLGPDRLQVGAQVDAIIGRGPFELRLDGRPSIAARSVVAATPAYATAGLFRDRDPQIAGWCDEVRYASVATCALAFPREAVAHPLNGSGFVVPRAERTGILAGSWLSSKWAGRAPEGSVLLRTVLGGARDPEAAQLGERAIIARSLEALRPLLGISGEPSFTRVYRWDRANAQHEVGHLDRMASIDRALARHPGLFITGSGFRGVGIPDCVADGRAAGNTVDQWLRTIEN
jgi:oxygen-dependent protoporphyrinogen oxidase